MIRISRQVYDALVDRALDGRPEEVCGVLSGSDGDPARVDAAHATENVAETPRVTYAIDPEEQFAVMEEIERDGGDVVGFYHSHPTGPPAPSRTDAAQATWTDYSYVIVSLDGTHPYVGAWRWTGDGFRPEAVGVEP